MIAGTGLRRGVARQRTTPVRWTNRIWARMRGVGRSIRANCGQDFRDSAKDPLPPPAPGCVGGTGLRRGCRAQRWTTPVRCGAIHPPPRRGRISRWRKRTRATWCGTLGARTRSRNSCQAPAMPNGRCRMHGGMSPGAPIFCQLRKSDRFRPRGRWCTFKSASCPERCEAHTLMAAHMVSSELSRALLSQSSGGTLLGAHRKQRETVS